MRLRVRNVGEGPGPGEVVVIVTTSTGSTEQIVVHTMGMDDNTIDIGNPIASNDDQRLVELPRESMSGRWRIWVPMSAMVEG